MTLNVKTYFNYQSKFYYEDLGLWNIRLYFSQLDPRHLMGNILYSDLIRRGFSIDVGAI